MLKPIPKAERVAKPCDVCGALRPYHERNAAGVPGWNGCTLHKAAPALLHALEQIAYSDFSGDIARAKARAALDKVK